jgi:hypothetical protein
MYGCSSYPSANAQARNHRAGRTRKEARHGVAAAF